MIKISGPWLRWEHEDEASLLSVMGPAAIENGYTAVNASVLRQAHRSGVELSSDLNRYLKLEIEARRVARVFRQAEDAEVDRYPRAQRLFKHQRVALNFMIEGARSGYCLADQPGVGKTAPAIAWAQTMHCKRVVVITPNSAKYQWAREIKRWDRRKPSIHVVDGNLEEQRNIINLVGAKGGYCVAHWQTLAHQASPAWLNHQWDLVILDEAHYLRNRDTKYFKNACKLKTFRRLALTGHPTVNSPTELWSILHFLYPETYGSYWRFFEQHIAAIPRHFGGWDIIGLRNPRLLRWEIGSFFIRRTKRKVFKDLPPIQRIPREVTMPTKHRREYIRIQKELILELESVEGEANVLTIPNVLSRLTRLRQHVVDPTMFGSSLASLKYPVVEEVLEELDKPTVIFTAFRKAALGLGQHLKKRKVGYIIGRRKKKNELDKKHFLRGKLDCLIVVMKAGGEALNLGKYGNVIFLDLPWSAMELEQAEGRVDRPEEGTGKLVPTTSYMIMVHNSYEDTLVEKINHKAAMFSQLFGADGVAHLTKTQLKEIVQ